MKLHEKLYILRKDKGKTQVETAKYIGVSQSMIGKWEHGTHEPTASNIIKLCEYFAISADELLGI